MFSLLKYWQVCDGEDTEAPIMITAGWEKNQTEQDGDGCQSHLLAAGQIDQVEFSGQLLLRLHVLLLDVDLEDAVATGAVLIHVCRGTLREHYENPLGIGSCSSLFMSVGEYWGNATDRCENQAWDSACKSILLTIIHIYGEQWGNGEGTSSEPTGWWQGK